MDNTIMHQRRYHRTLLWARLIVCLIVFSLLAPALAKLKYFSVDDFFAYWAGGKFTLAGENPYDPQNKEELQIKLGGHTSSAYISQNMLNPPWAVSLVMPFSLISYPMSRLLWLLFSAGTILMITQLCTYDRVILLPAIVQVSIWILSDWKRWYSYLLVFYYLIMNILYLSLHKLYS
jgi:hypothetical protein